MQFGKTRQTLLSSAAASSHMLLVPPCCFSFSPYDFHDNIRRAGSSPYSTGGNFILVFSRGGAGILISIVGGC